MVLEELKSRESGTIIKVRGESAFRKRITEMGFVRGQKITVIKNAPLKDPVEYSLMGYRISLRRAEASLIDVEKFESPGIIPDPVFNLRTDSLAGNIEGSIEKTINIGLIGNPNSGKTSIFNIACHSHEHVGNYSGVTVDIKHGQTEYRGYKFNFFDLPGTYSLSHFSPEEIYVRDYIFNSHPDIILNVVDSTNLERNLYLTTQLLDMGVNLVIALNMFDELQLNGDKFDYVSFGRMIGAKVIPTIATKGKGLAQLFEAIINKYHERAENRRTVSINYGNDLEGSISKLVKQLEKSGIAGMASRFTAIKLLEKDQDLNAKLTEMNDPQGIKEKTLHEINSLEDRSGDDTVTMIANARYGFVAGALRETYIHGHSQKTGRSERIDNILTNKLWGLPIFFLILWLMFESTFRIGKFPVSWIESGVSFISGFADLHLPSGDLKDLIINGIIGGIGGVVIFLPNILILFLFISILEDTGYMARAAFLMDKVMHTIGLHGKSFIPLVMGFGCNVPAILSTRIIESRNNRIVTMLIMPFMSCSARLPVYILIIGTFFPSHQGVILFGIYMLGILLAAMTALLLKRFHFRREEQPFVMELPPYRIPTGRNIIRHMWHKSYQYLQKIGSVVLIASVIIWGLGYYPGNQHEQGISKTEQIIENNFPGQVQGENSISSPKKSSYLERIGKFIEPAIQPLGFDWKMGVSLLSGVAAKEVVVSTMGVIYVPEDNGINTNLKDRLLSHLNESGEPVYTTAACLAFLVFILIYFPCIAVVVTIAKESGSALYSAFLVFYTTGLAWVISFAVFQLTNLLL